jgi:uroporphyrinogen decarboxylase
MGGATHSFLRYHQPDFIRLQRTLLHREAGLTPLIELGIDRSIKEKILGAPPGGIKDDIRFMQLMGYDFIKLQPRIQMDLNRKSTGPGSDAPDRAWSPQHQGIISSWESFESYRWPGKQDIDYSLFEQAKELLPDGMGIIGQYGDIFTNVWELMGFETFAMAIYEQPDLVAAIFEKTSELILSMFDTMADMDWVGALWYSDDIAYSSNLMVSPQFLRKHFFPLLAHIGQLAGKRNIPYIYHTDGVLWEVFDDIIDAGVTAIHPIEPKSMDIRKVKQTVGDRLCLCGGIEVDLLARGKPEEVAEMTGRFLTEISAGGGYCAGSSNSIPEYVRVENYLAMLRTTHEFNQHSR